MASKICAFKRYGRCTAINVKECPKICAFEKTEVELLNGRAAAIAKVNALSDLQKQIIEEKYYIRTGIPQTLEQIKTVFGGDR